MISNLLPDPSTDGIIYLSEPDTYKDFESAYTSVRGKENRMFTDAEVKELPTYNGATSALMKEWKIRKISCDELVSYISKNPRIKNVLEVGSGNCWLANQIASKTDAVIYANDINLLELKQGSEVFSADNLRFVYGDLFDSKMPSKAFDLILFSASIQYFKSLRNTILRSYELLTPKGEVHIIDTPFYQESEVRGAKRRSKEYYEDQGDEAMSEFYFHHTWQSLYSFEYEILYDPSTSIFDKLLNRTKNPFSWIKLTP